ncbi:MAG: Uma2 family endonuclease [Isosphaeraceae bacterium]
MATLTETRYTPEDLLMITDRPMPELIDGQLLERPLMGQKSDAIAAAVLLTIGLFIREHRLGLVNGAQGSYQIFPHDPKKVRIPDVSFTRQDRLPTRGPAEGHSRTVPDLVVEVISPHDIAADLEEKVEDFLSAGVPLIWVLNPETRTVQVHRGDGSGSRLRPGDTLDGEDVLPGFRCEVSALFEGIG